MNIGWFVLCIIFQLASAQNDECRCANQTAISDCSCYCHLENSLLSSDSNRQNLTRSFFPITSSPAEFVAVTYKFGENSTKKVWYWGAQASYFLQPFEVFQYTSLFFGGSVISHTANALELTLAPECEKLEPGDENMKFLTLRLKLYAKSWTTSALNKIMVSDSYHAKAYDKTMYTSALRGNSRQILIISTCTSITTTVIATLIVVSVAMLIGCTKHTRDSFLESKCINKLQRRNPAIFAITVVSVFANVYMFCLSWTAMSVWEQDHFNTLISDLLDFDEINYLNRSSIGMLVVYNTITLFLSVIVLGIVAALVCLKETDSEDEDKKFCQKVRLLRLISVLCACLSICAHSPYIAVAYLNDEYHATGIFVYYSLLGCLLFSVSWIAFNYYYNNSDVKSKENSSDVAKSNENPSDGAKSNENSSDGATSNENSSDGAESNENPSDGAKSNENSSDGARPDKNSSVTANIWSNVINFCKRKLPIVMALFVIIFMTLVFFAVVTCYFLLIPINKSISEFPNRVVGIFMSGGFVISTYFLCKLFVYVCRKNKQPISRSTSPSDQPQSDESASQEETNDQITGRIKRESTKKLEVMWRDRSESERKFEEYVVLKRIKDEIQNLPRTPSKECQGNSQAVVVRVQNAETKQDGSPASDGSHNLGDHNAQFKFQLDGLSKCNGSLNASEQGAQHAEYCLDGSATGDGLESAEDQLQGSYS